MLAQTGRRHSPTLGARENRERETEVKEGEADRGKRGRGTQKKNWRNNAKEWTGVNFALIPNGGKILGVAETDTEIIIRGVPMPTLGYGEGTAWVPRIPVSMAQCITGETVQQS